LLVWPHDYDQFDHAARIEALGVGRRLRPRRVVQDLVAVHEEPRYRENAIRMQAVLMDYDPIGVVEARLAEALRSRAEHDTTTRAQE
jgi:UDP:flavonoid glycosyltransferase YjiC (YdhE family)